MTSTQELRLFDGSRVQVRNQILQTAILFAASSTCAQQMLLAAGIEENGWGFLHLLAFGISGSLAWLMIRGRIGSLLNGGRQATLITPSTGGDGVR